MKKQGAFYLKLLSISLAGLTVLFLLLRLCSGNRDYSLREVIYCEVGDGIPVSGFAVREEQLLLSREPFLRYTAGEGQWLSGGQCYAQSRCCEEGLQPIADLCVSRAGYFSVAADGFESLLSYEALQSLTVQEFARLQGIRLGPSGDAAGRLVYGQTWYFAALLPEAELKSYCVGQELNFRFDGVGQAPLELSLCHLSPPQEGYRLAVFSCSRGLLQVLSLRRLSGQIVTESLRGLQVPKEALYHYEGATGVYVLVGQRAKWKEVTILRDLGEAVLVAYTPADTDTLRTEDELIITTQEIENGKVIS